MRRLINHLLHRRDLWLVRHLDQWLPRPSIVGDAIFRQTIYAHH